MAVYQIVKEGNPVLREKSKPITRINDAAIRLLDNLRDTLRDTPKGVGLSAPQIGISKRAFVVELAESEIYLEMVNPELTDMEGSEEGWEGCLSVPGIEGLVPRAGKLKVLYTDRESRQNELVAEGYLARIIQHENDHLDGLLFRDKAVTLNTEPEKDRADDQPDDGEGKREADREGDRNGGRENGRKDSREVSGEGGGQ